MGDTEFVVSNTSNKKVLFTDKEIETIIKILNQGNDVKLKRKKDSVVISEVKETIKNK